jgi:hypothetical protein
MDGEAIGRILDAVRPGSERLGDSPDEMVVAVRRGWSVERVPLSTRRQHRFDDLESFAAFMKREADGAKADVLLGTKQVSAFIAADVIRGDRVACELPYSPSFTAWSALLGKPLSQKTFFDHLRAFESDIPNDGGVVLLTELGKLGVAQGEEITTQIDERGTIVYAAATSKTQVQGKIPPSFAIRVPVYRDPAVEFEKHEIELLLDVQTRGGLTFTLTAPLLEYALIEARQRVAERLRQLLGEPFQVWLGNGAVEP